MIAGDLSDWRFEGNLTNTSRSNMNISFSGATYFDSTSFPPVPVARFLGAPNWTDWISHEPDSRSNLMPQEVIRIRQRRKAA